MTHIEYDDLKSRAQSSYMGLEYCKSYGNVNLLQNRRFRRYLVRSTLPYPALPNPVASLYWAPFWRCCHGIHGPQVHTKACAWSRARRHMYMHMHVCCRTIHIHCPSVCVQCCCGRYERTIKMVYRTYTTCMRFTLHCELRAYPSYGHPPRWRCPGKGGLSVL